MNWIEALKEFEGIIGAILGTIATLITTKVLSGLGKVRFRLNSPEYSYGKIDHYGQHNTTENDDWNSFQIEGSYLLQNTSDSLKSIYDIHLKLYTADGIKTVKLYNLNDMSQSKFGTHYGDLDFLNLKPKELVPLNWKYTARREEGVVSERLNRIDFCYRIADKKYFSLKKIKLI